MLKPPFSGILPTRTGPAIGGGMERKMLSHLGGGAGFLKKFMNNLDGSTTMLQTRGGMPRFITTGGLRRNDFTNDFTMTDANFYEGSNVDHQFHHTPQSYQGTFKMWLVNLAGVPGLRIMGLSGGFIIDGDTVTTPPGCLWYPESVTLEADGLPAPLPAPGTALYEIHIGPTRNSKPNVFGVGWMI